jgi:hypothetical protein
MDRVLALQILFAVAVVAVGASVFLTAAGRASRSGLTALAGLLGVLAVGAWIVFAFDPSAEAAIAAGGLSACAAIEAGLILVRHSLARARRVDGELAAAEGRLRTVIRREEEERTAGLERTLARARADSVSLLLEEERRIAEARRQEFAEREQQVGVELTKTLAATQTRVDSRLAEWAQDLDRAQQAFAAQVTKLGERQRQLLSEAEARIQTEVDRLESETEQQRAAVLQLRDQIARTAHEAVTAGTAELESAGLERKRALQDLGEQLRRREHALSEQIEREEAEAVRRIQAGFADVERRQVEALERAVSRASASYSEAAAEQFADSIKAAREDAAHRLSRELDRAVQAFAREASTVLAERLAQVGDAGAQRLEKRLSGIAAGIERQREEIVEGFERRLVEAEGDLRRRMELLVRDTDSERTVLKTRLDELARQIDDLVADTRERLSELEGLRTR